MPIIAEKQPVPFTGNTEIDFHLKVVFDKMNEILGPNYRDSILNMFQTFEDTYDNMITETIHEMSSV